MRKIRRNINKNPLLESHRRNSNYRNRRINEDYEALPINQNYKLQGDIQKLFKSFEKDDWIEVLDDWFNTEYTDGEEVQCYYVECDDTDSIHLGWMIRDINYLMEDYPDYGFEMDSNDNGFYGRTFVFFKYIEA